MNKLIIVGITALVVALIGGTTAYFTLAQNDSIFNDVAEQSAFPIYDPTYLPGGYELQQDTISSTTQVVLFAAKNAEGKLISFTQQPSPPGFDYDSFYKQRYVGLQDADSIYGRGKVGLIDSNMGGSLATESTWIIVNGPEDLPAKEMKDIVAGLKPIKI